MTTTDAHAHRPGPARRGPRPSAPRSPATPPATTPTAPSSTEGLDCLREAGLLALAVPAELGGGGATVRQVAMVQRELAHHCGSTALATSMHQHVVCFTAWRYRRGLPGAEATLRRVADEGIVLVSTGGADFTRPRGEATKVDGGYRVSGPQGVRQPVVARHGDVDDVRLRRPRAGPAGAEHGRADRRRRRHRPRQLGHPRHAGHRQQRHRHRGRVRARRAGARQPPLRRVDPPLQVIVSIAMPIISAVYLGVAEAAYEAAVDAAAAKADDVVVQRQVGLMAHRLQVASWALDGRPRRGRRRPRPVGRAVRRGHGGQARDRPRRRRGVRHRHGGRRRGRLLQGLDDRALLPRHPGRQVPPAHARSRRWSTPAGSPSASPSTRPDRSAVTAPRCRPSRTRRARAGGCATDGCGPARYGP